MKQQDVCLYTDDDERYCTRHQNVFLFSKTNGKAHAVMQMIEKPSREKS